MGSIGEQALVANAMWARAVAASLRVRVCVCACVRVFAWPENVTQRRVNWRHMVVFLTSEFVVTIVAVQAFRYGSFSATQFCTPHLTSGLQPSAIPTSVCMGTAQCSKRFCFNVAEFPEAADAARTPRSSTSNL